MSRKNIRQPTHRMPITEGEQRWLFSVAIRKQEFFKEAGSLITEELFTEDEGWLMLVWRVVTAHFRANGNLPSRRLITTGCNAELEINPDCIPEGHELKITKFLHQAFMLETGDMPMRSALE